MGDDGGQDQWNNPPLKYSSQLIGFVLVSWARTTTSFLVFGGLKGPCGRFQEGTAAEEQYEGGMLRSVGAIALGDCEDRVSEAAIGRKHCAQISGHAVRIVLFVSDSGSVMSGGG